VDLAVEVAANYRLLCSLGITIRKIVDLIIGTYCIEHGHELLHDDRDFEPMRVHLGLQVI
jgi:predicted nucleic acid-binding protein